MVDRAALSAQMASDSRLDAAVVAGSNGAVATALNAEDPAGALVFDDVPDSVFVSTLAGVSLTVDQRASVDLLLSTRTGTVPLSDPSTSAFARTLPALAVSRLEAAAQRRQTFAESASIVSTGVEVRLPDVRKAAEYVAKHHIVASGQRPLRT